MRIIYQRSINYLLLKCILKGFQRIHISINYIYIQTTVKDLNDVTPPVRQRLMLRRGANKQPVRSNDKQTVTELSHYKVFIRCDHIMRLEPCTVSLLPPPPPTPTLGKCL